jgi:6-phosphogluconolactonase
MKPQIRIFKNVEDLSQHAANLFAEQATEAIQERGRFLVALNGGSTPTRMLEFLGNKFRESVDWSRRYIFWGDERIVPPDHPENSYGQARDLFLQHVPIPTGNVRRVQTELGADEAVREYSFTLKQFVEPPLEHIRFDLVYLGMGEDGHTASLFPGSPMASSEPVILVTAEYQGRPAQRVTLTPLVINNARMVAFMATGEKKALTLTEVLSGRYDPERYPAQRIDLKAGKIIWLVDEDAASRLPRNLVRKFCEG